MSQTVPDVSVLICTYNRAESLRDTLTSLLRQQTNGVDFEILVIDNNSKDQTKEVVQEFSKQIRQPVRYLFEGRQGISFARNAGIQTARGEVIAFLDDDCIADPGWLQGVWSCFQETGADGMGGKIERLWRSQHPPWLAEELNGPLISQDLGLFRKRWNSRIRHPIGANVAYRRTVFERHGFFREELGRRGEKLIGGEDREMFLRLIKAGCVIFYEPKAAVAHKVEKERLSKEYLRRWYWEIGQTLGHEMPRRWHHGLTVAPLWVWEQVVRSSVRHACARLKPMAGEAERFASEMWVRFHAGIVKERFSHWLPRWLPLQKCVFEKGGK